MIDKLNKENLQLKRGISGKVKDDKYSNTMELEKTIEDLKKEKIGFEESLKDLTLVNEEQRKYIDVLKEAIEAKIDDLGLKETLGKEQGNICDAFAKLVKMKREIEDTQKNVGLTEVSNNYR